MEVLELFMSGLITGTAAAIFLIPVLIVLKIAGVI